MERVRGIEEINHKQLGRQIDLMYKVKQPIMIKGATGIGKSMFVKNKFKAISKRENLKFVEWNELSLAEKESYIQDAEKRAKTMLFVDERVNLKDNTDNKGIPRLDGKYLQYVKTLIINVASMPDSHVIFFKDEINLATPSVMNSEYQWILDRQVDDMAFGPNSYTLAAGNRAIDRHNGSEMPDPLKNRFFHFLLRPPSVEEWTDWAVANDIDNRVVAFLNFKETAMFTWKPDMRDDAFATPRSWALLSAAIKGNENLEDIEIASRAAIGGIGHEFTNFIRLEMKINLDEYLKDPKKLEALGSDQMDVKHAIISSCVERYRKKPEILEKALKFVNHLPAQFSIYFLKMMRMANDKHFSKNVMKTSMWEEIRDNYSKYLLDI